MTGTTEANIDVTDVLRRLDKAMSERDSLRATVAQLRSERDTAVRALAPFVEMADVCDYFNRMDERTLCTFVRDGRRHDGPNAGDCRAARDAIPDDYALLATNGGTAT